MKAIITAPDPHCRVWARVTASLWGHADDHDLDEPVCLSHKVDTRISYEEDGRMLSEAVDLVTNRAGRHVSVRFYFRNGEFVESFLTGGNAVRPPMVVGL